MERPRREGFARAPLLSLVLFYIPLAAGAATRPSRLRRVLVVARHSVKNPYPESGAVQPGVIDLPLSSFTRRTLPDMGTTPGELTPHGQRLMELMGAYHRERYAEILGRTDCSQIAVHADPASSRDVNSAAAFARGLVQGTTCHPQVNSAALYTHLVRIFRDQPQPWDIARGCGTPTTEELVAMLGSNEGPLRPETFRPWLNVYRRQLGRVQEVTQCCSEDACRESAGSGLCTMFSLPTAINGNVTWLALGGPLGVASKFAEIFQMQYCAGVEAGWGLQEEDVVELMSLDELPFNRLGANDFTARNMGSELLEDIVQTLVGHGASPNVALYFGHDTNLQFLRKMLKLSWLSDGWWPNIAEPGSELVFELYEPEGTFTEPTVRILKIAAKPKQQRQALPLTMAEPPSVAPLWVPGCDSVYCPLTQFVALARAAIRPECLQSAGALQQQAQQPTVRPEPQQPLPTQEAREQLQQSQHANQEGAQAWSLGESRSTQAPVPSPEGIVGSEASSSSHPVWLLAFCGAAFLGWRYYGAKMAANRGYETIGSGSGTQSSSRIGHHSPPDGFEL